MPKSSLWDTILGKCNSNKIPNLAPLVSHAAGVPKLMGRSRCLLSIPKIPLTHPQHHDTPSTSVSAFVGPLRARKVMPQQTFRNLREQGNQSLPKGKDRSAVRAEPKQKGVIHPSSRGGRGWSGGGGGDSAGPRAPTTPAPPPPPLGPPANS